MARQARGKPVDKRADIWALGGVTVNRVRIVPDMSGIQSPIQPWTRCQSFVPYNSNTPPLPK
jgi:hypothetical protein